MTEDEWLACDDPAPMLGYLRGANYPSRTDPREGLPERGSQRKVALFVCAVCERVQHSPMNAPTLRGMAALRRFSAAEISLADLLRMTGELYEQAADGSVGGLYFPFYDHRVNEPYTARWIAEKAAIVTAWHVARDAIQRDDPDAYEREGPNWKTHGLELPEWQAAYRQEEWGQASLARDIFGNPFRPVAVDTAWRTSTVVALAEQMYASRDFGAMPILADALEEAGCDNADVLSHCRDATQPHVRGCWVVDLLLGKE